MNRVVHSVLHFLENEDGPTAVETAVMMALIIVVCIAALAAIGTSSNATYTKVNNTMNASGS